MREIENIEITYKTIIYILSGIVTIGGATAVITKWATPFKAMRQNIENKASKAELEEVKEKVTELQRYQDIDHDRLKTVETGNEKICKCILAITDHELTGNSIEKLRKAKDEMQEYLIERK